MEAMGTIVFSTIQVLNYGFDIFTVVLPADLTSSNLTEICRTDGVSRNFNAQFTDENTETITFVSERTGSALLYHTSMAADEPRLLPTDANSFFYDRPAIKNGCLFYVSTHERPSEYFKSWAAVYMTRLDTRDTVRLTPVGSVDYSPALSHSGKLVAVASYGSSAWKGDFEALDTEIVVFPVSDPDRRIILNSLGGWPTFSGESTIFFHRKTDDGWWSIYRFDLNEYQNDNSYRASRVTPAGIHVFTPAASHDGKYLAVATRRKGNKFRHIEIFDLKSKLFLPITEKLNPNFHHYNPFFSLDSGKIGYHRFRGESMEKIPNINPVPSPIQGLQLLQVHGTFPSFSPAGDFVAITTSFVNSPGLMILRFDGSKRRALLKSPPAFCTAWSPVEKGVIFTTIGPPFHSNTTAVEIARISFNPDDVDNTSEVITAEVNILTRKDSANNAFPACSPDGKHLVIRSSRSGHKNLYILDAMNGELADGSGIQRLTEGEWIDTMPSWSPDGELIAFSSNRHNPANSQAFSIYLVRPDGSDLRRVYVAGLPGSNDVDKERFNHVCFSPDSKLLLFAANLGAVSAEPISMPNQFQPYGDLWACQLDGSGLTRLTCSASESGTPAWHSILEVFDKNIAASFEGDKLTGRFEEPLWLTCENLN